MYRGKLPNYALSKKEEQENTDWNLLRG